jgi:hypothetical protein
MLHQLFDLTEVLLLKIIGVEKVAHGGLMLHKLESMAIECILGFFTCDISYGNRLADCRTLIRYRVPVSDLSWQRTVSDNAS